jgi:hypothetical protein
MFYGYQICSRYEEGGCSLAPFMERRIKKQKMLDEGLDPNDFDEK